MATLIDLPLGDDWPRTDEPRGVRIEGEGRGQHGRIACTRVALVSSPPRTSVRPVSQVARVEKDEDVFAAALGGCRATLHRASD